MFKADLHVHSKYSECLSEKFLADIGAAESYSEPEFIYAAAKAQGMDFVTITDHNSIAGALLLTKEHPQDTFTGLEATAYFPEDGCPVHILIYGLNEKQFDVIQKIRTNIYDLRDYIRNENLSYSVAHAPYSRNSKLDVLKLEKLILLFDVFEVINGGIGGPANGSWKNVLSNLTLEKIEQYYKIHRIEPFGEAPWIKGFTGGSDDHGGLFCGKTYTVSNVSGLSSFVDSIKNRQTTAGGRNSDFRSLAFTLYKVVHDFSKSRKSASSGSLLNRVGGIIFDNNKLRFRDKLVIKRMRRHSRRKGDISKIVLLDMIENINYGKSVTIDEKIDLIYDSLSQISDEMLKSIACSVSGELKNGNIGGIIRSIGSTVYGLVLSAPFMATFRYMRSSRKTIKEFRARDEDKGLPASRVLWFSDTANTPQDAVSLIETAGAIAPLSGKDVGFAVAGNAPGFDENSANVVRLPLMREICFKNFDNYTLNLPSLLNSLKAIDDYEPDEIYISTVGPVALLGVLVAKLMQIRAVGIYSPEYHREIRKNIAADSIKNIFDGYISWFYSMMDEVFITGSGDTNALHNVYAKSL